MTTLSIKQLQVRNNWYCCHRHMQDMCKDISIASTWTCSILTGLYNERLEVDRMLRLYFVVPMALMMNVSYLPCASMLFIALSLQFAPSFAYTSFVFGDSLVDAGNNDYLFTLSKADIPPYGIDFAASGGRPTGRFTNGRTISDIVGQALGEKSFPPPYLAPSTDVGAISGGVNYASGASGILDDTGSLFIGRVPLSKQISYFEQTRSYMVELLEGENAIQEFLKGAVFSITIGSNDILNYLAPSVPFFSKDKVSPNMLQDIMVSNLTTHIKRLHELGARKFVVVGVGPLGCIPYVRALEFDINGRCSRVANRLIQGYNMKLRKMLDKLNHDLGPDSVFVYANSYDIFMDIIRNYRRYGFDNAHDPCCGGSFPPFLCFKGPGANSSSVLCEDRSKYVFWDAYHPTEAANAIVAERLVDGDERATYPINMRRLDDYRP